MSDNVPEGNVHPHRAWLFTASCISLLTTSMIFAIRGDIQPALSSQFHLSGEQMGLIWGPAFWGFTIAIFICGVLVDTLGMKLMHALSSIGFIVGASLVLLAPAPVLPDGEVVSSIFAHKGTLMLYVGFLVMGLSQGVVEGVINPLAVTLYPDKKRKMLNVLHAWWPGGMIIGGLLAFSLTKIQVCWQIKFGFILIPSLIYLAMCLMRKYPQTERVAANVSMGDMIKACMKPLFILMFCCMWLTAATELGPDQWFPRVMKDLTGLEGILFLCYTAGLMFILRFFFGGVAHKFSPFAVLTTCAVLTGLGLYWLGSLRVGTTTMVAFSAATVFGIGKTFFWPTMLGIVSERFPKSGALGINLMGGAGMASIAVVLPLMGAQLDQHGPGAALKLVSGLAVILVAIFLPLGLYFYKKGGYKAQHISE